jgi:hypothetical protein
MRSSSRSDGTSTAPEYRWLLDAIRPALLRLDSSETQRTVKRCLERGDLAPLARLLPREKRTLLELVDGAVATSGRPDPRALVALTEALSPVMGSPYEDAPAQLIRHPGR